MSLEVYEIRQSDNYVLLPTSRMAEVKPREKVPLMVATNLEDGLPALYVWWNVNNRTQQDVLGEIGESYWLTLGLRRPKPEQMFLPHSRLAANKKNTNFAQVAVNDRVIRIDGDLADGVKDRFPLLADQAASAKELLAVTPYMEFLLHGEKMGSRILRVLTHFGWPLEIARLYANTADVRLSLPEVEELSRAIAQFTVGFPEPISKNGAH